MLRFLVVLLLLLFLTVPAAPRRQHAHVDLKDAPGSLQPWFDFLDRSAGVVDQQDVVLRNYQITQSYYDLSILLHSILSRGQSGWGDANWPTVATWASNSVGISIRRDTLPSWVLLELRQYLPKIIIEVLLLFPDLLDRIFHSVLEKTSGYLAGGNVLVFHEVGFSLGRFGVYFANLTRPDEDRWNLYAQTFNSSDPIQMLLQQATKAYYNAMWSTDKKTKSEWMLMGNMLVGLTEQTRLQPFLYGAELDNRSISFHIPLYGNVTINVAALITKVLIILLFPNELLYAGRDVPPRPWDGQDWPEDLVTIENPDIRKQYINLVGQTSSLRGTAASNWVELSQRMRYVVPLFRSRQDDLYVVQCPPFTPQQVKEIWADIKPNSKDLCMANCCENRTL